MPATHQVVNQAPALRGHDVTAADPALAAGLAGSGLVVDEDLRTLGVAAGSEEIIDAARLAEACTPILRTHSRSGFRIDEVDYHPSWHALMTRAVEAGLQGWPWDPAAGDQSHLRRAAGFYAWTQAEAGHLCPISMTYAAVPALRRQPELADQFEPGLRSRTYEFGLSAPAGKAGLLAGMSMTEKQGGSDVRAGTTLAIPVDGGYRLTGHKWFTSAPMNDLFLTLAQAPEGLSCFLLPRVLPDGHRNAIRLQRLKEKLGNRSNASAEIEYDGATGWLVGEAGRGTATILEMVSMTRLDCVLGSAGGIRAALSEATHHAAHRSAFGRKLADQPVMTAVLADLTIESWAATLTGLRLAAAVDAGETALLRIALPVAKFWVCKRAVPVIAEALECLGGNGYVEESVMPRLLRESPLNGIWEGSGNVAALDALRALRRAPEAGQALLAELELAAGTDPWFDAALARLRDLLDGDGVDEGRARTLASVAGRLFAASRLIRLAPPEVAALYCATRLGGTGDRVLGDLPTGYPLRDIVTAVTPTMNG